MKSRYRNILILAEILVLLLLCYFPLCYRIDAMAIRQWDEARNAVNAMEMLQNKNFIVRYFEGNPEIWEVKPPLLIWLQVISLKAFGANELAVRFPVILSTFLTVLFMIWYFNKYHQNRYIGYLASMVLVTSNGYVDSHIARTGDHDALLILLLTVILFLYYRFLISARSNQRQLLVITVLFVMGVLTKSVAALFVLPGMLLATFMLKAHRKLFLNKWFYIALLLFTACTASYYGGRELMQPGYLKAVWQWELFPRYLNSENTFDSGTIWQYGINLVTSRFTYWIWFLILSAIVMPLISGDRKFFYYLLVNSLAFLIVISLGPKARWYDGPLFPLFSAMIAMFLVSSFQSLVRAAASFKKYLVAASLTLIFFLFPGYAIVKKVSVTSEYPWDLERFSLCYFLRIEENIDNLTGLPVSILFDEYYGHLLFYMEAINYNKGKEVVHIGRLDSVKPGDMVLVSQQSVLDSIQGRYNCKVVIEKKPVYLLEIGLKRGFDSAQPDIR